MPNMLKGKVVLVTGAGGGIGREMAPLAAREGARSWSTISAAPSTARAGGSDAGAEGVRRDRLGRRQGRANADSVTDPAGAERMIKTAVENFGPHRRRHQQCRHPARPHLPSREPCRLEDGDRRISTVPSTSPRGNSHFKERSPAPSCTSRRRRGWSAISVRPTTRRPRWASSACRARSRSTWRPSTCARTASRRSPGRA